jgi:hypothetical protein
MHGILIGNLTTPTTVYPGIILYPDRTSDERVMADTLATPTRPNPARSRSGTTATTASTASHLISPSLLRVASSSSTSTVRLSKDHAGQSGLRVDNDDDGTIGDPIGGGGGEMSLGIPQAGPSRSRTPSLYLGKKEGSTRSPSHGLSPSSTGNSSSSLSPSLSPSPSREVIPDSVEQNGTGAEAGGSNLADARIGLKRLISRDLTTNPVMKPTLSPTLSSNISGNGEAKGTGRGTVMGNGKGKERESESKAKLRHKSTFGTSAG